MKKSYLAVLLFAAFGASATTGLFAGCVGCSGGGLSPPKRSKIEGVTDRESSITSLASHCYTTMATPSVAGANLAFCGKLAARAVENSRYGQVKDCSEWILKTFNLNDRAGIRSRDKPQAEKNNLYQDGIGLAEADKIIERCEKLAGSAGKD